MAEPVIEVQTGAHQLERDIKKGCTPTSGANVLTRLRQVESDFKS